MKKNKYRPSADEFTFCPKTIGKEYYALHIRSVFQTEGARALRFFFLDDLCLMSDDRTALESFKTHGYDETHR